MIIKRLRGFFEALYQQDSYRQIDKALIRGVINYAQINRSASYSYS